MTEYILLTREELQMNYMNLFIGYSIVLFILDIISIQICEWLSMKKSKYNCKDCKNWRCHKKYCERKQEEIK